MARPELLAEVSEQAARGSVASTYVDIRRVLGVQTVMLVYRVLAVEQGRLERVWGAIATNLAVAATQRGARDARPTGDRQRRTGAAGDDRDGRN